MAASALTLAVLVALVVLGVTRIGLAQVGHELVHVGGGWVAAGVALMIGVFLARAESWFAVVRVALLDQPMGRRRSRGPY